MYAVGEIWFLEVSLLRLTKQRELLNYIGVGYNFSYFLFYRVIDFFILNEPT